MREDRLVAKLTRIAGRLLFVAPHQHSLADQRELIEHAEELQQLAKEWRPIIPTPNAPDYTPL